VSPASITVTRRSLHRHTAYHTPDINTASLFRLVHSFRPCCDMSATPISFHDAEAHRRHIRASYNQADASTVPSYRYYTGGAANSNSHFDPDISGVAVDRGPYLPPFNLTQEGIDQNVISLTQNTCSSGRTEWGGCVLGGLT
jgi:hypothetical protein